MSDPLKLPIEPLPPKRWEAIERGVLDRLDAPRESVRPAPERRRSPLVAISVAAAIAAAAGLVFAMRPAALPEVVPTANRLASTRIATDLSSVSTNLGEVGVTLAARSELTAVGSDAEGWLVVLEEGTATFEVPPRRQRPSLVVQAGGTRIEVVGTRFTVTRADRVSVEVDHGQVRVLDGADEWNVGAGERWPTETASITPSPSLSPSPSLPPSPSPSLSPAPSLPLATSDARQPSPRPLPFTGEGGEASRSATPAPAPAPTARERFEHAASLEVARPDEALALYAALESDGGAWAANALFARGRLALELGRRAEANLALTRYLERHPAGPNAEDARALLSGSL